MPGIGVGVGVTRRRRGSTFSIGGLPSLHVDLRRTGLQYQDAGATTLASATGDPVFLWVNETGGTNGTAVDNANRLARAVTGGVKGDGGTAQFWRLLFPSATTGAFTFAVRCILTAGGLAYGDAWVGGPASGGVRTFYASDTNLQHFDGAGITDLGTIAIGTPFVIGYRRNGGAIQVRKNSDPWQTTIHGAGISITSIELSPSGGPMRASQTVTDALLTGAAMGEPDWLDLLSAWA